MRSPIPVLALLALLTSLPARAEAPPPRAPPPAAPSVITRPDWASLPDGDVVARFYPEHAARLNLGGKAVLDCTVDENGDLQICAVESETPPGEGFGEAALRMAKFFRLKPTTIDGKPVGGGRIRIPIVFGPPGPSDEPKDIPVEEVVANLAKTVPVDGSYVLLTPPGYDPQYPGYFRLPGRKIGKGTVELSIFGVARTPQLAIDGPWTYGYTRVAFDCGNRRSRVIGNSFFRPNGELLASPPRDQSWHPFSNKPWDRQVQAMACGGKPVPGTIRKGLGEVITAVRGGEGLPPPSALRVFDWR